MKHINEYSDFLQSLNKEGKINEGPGKGYYIKVAVRDAKKALSILDDMYRKKFDISGSDTYYFKDEDMAFDAKMDLGARDIQVTDTNIEESISEAKIMKDLEKIGGQIDYLSDADDATKKIWKKAGVNTEDDNGNHPTIILYSYVNSWPETKKLLDKSKIKYKELEDPNSAGESFIVFNEGTFIDLRIVNENVNDEIELALTNWLNVLADGNAVAVTDLYLGDGVLLGTVAKDIKQGHTEIQEYFEMFLKKSPIGSIDSFILQNFGDICISDGTYTFEIDGDGGNRESVAARYTYVWKKENKKWMIATHHSSVNP